MTKKPISLILLIVYEAMFGVIKIIFGIAFLLEAYALSHALSVPFLKDLIGRELAEDPQDLLANWLALHGLNSAITSMQIGWFLVIFGLINFVIAVGLWFRSRSIRNLGLLFFGAVALFGIYHLFLKFSFLELAALLIDVFIFYYFLRIFPKYLKK